MKTEQTETKVSTPKSELQHISFVSFDGDVAAKYLDITRRNFTPSIFATCPSRLPREEGGIEVNIGEKEVSERCWTEVDLLVATWQRKARFTARGARAGNKYRNWKL